MSLTNKDTEMMIAIIESLSDVCTDNERKKAADMAIEWLKENTNDETETLRVTKLFNHFDDVYIEDIPTVQTSHDIVCNDTKLEQATATIQDTKYHSNTLANKALSMAKGLLFTVKKDNNYIPSSMTKSTGDKDSDMLIVVTLTEWRALWRFIDSLKTRMTLAEIEIEKWSQLFHQKDKTCD